MRWYTREWQVGDLSDEEADARDAAYAAYVRSVADRIPAHVVEFALPSTQHMSVDDAKVDRVEIDEARRRVLLRLLNGDLQAGYGKLDIELIDAELVAPNVEKLRAIRCADVRRAGRASRTTRGPTTAAR